MGSTNLAFIFGRDSRDTSLVSLLPSVLQSLTLVRTCDSLGLIETAITTLADGSEIPSSIDYIVGSGEVIK